MLLDLHRSPSDQVATISELHIADAFECYILEDVVRAVKVDGITAIPEGRYDVVITWSPRFGRMLPLLVDVPQFAGVRIHPGNTAADTEGCLLPGQSKGLDMIGQSRAAFDALFAKIKAAQDAGESVAIEIKNAP